MTRTAIAVLAFGTMISAAQAEDRMKAYTDCWNETAVASIRAAGVDNEQTVIQAIDKANADCNGLARHAAQTVGKEAVNDMWRYLEVQFTNAILRENRPVPTIATAPARASGQRLDLKGLAVDEHVSMEQVEQTLGVRCGDALEGNKVCTGNSTVADYPSRLRVGITNTGILRFIHVSFHSDGYERIYRAFMSKFGEPRSEASTVQNKLGATFRQEEHRWGNADRSIYMKRYTNDIHSGSISFSGVTDAEMFREFQRQQGSTASNDL